MKILMIAGASRSVIWFRQELIKYLQDKGNEVIVIACDAENQKEIESLGVEFYCAGGDNRDTGIISNIKYINVVKKLVKRIKPDRIMTFQVKPNTFGIMGAKFAGYKDIIAMVEGLGDVFINKSFKWSIIRIITCLLYKYAFQSCANVFFINQDDKDLFVKKKIVEINKSIVIPGIGVNVDHFKYKPLVNKTVFLMVARMLKTKGVYEYCEAARIVKQQYNGVTFNYLGPEGTVKLDDIKDFVDDGIINYLGETKDVRPFLEEASVLVLPSYREGFGLCIAEAASVGRPAIATNTIGCKDAIKDKYSGFLVDVKNVNQIVDKMVWFIENPIEIERMGKNAREYTEQNFNQKTVNNKIYDVIMSID